MNSSPLLDYFNALERLINDSPINVNKGIRITNDSVALEAGRGKGSIKKSRPIFAELISAINDAAIKQSYGNNQQKEKMFKAKNLADKYRRELEAALARELSLLYELYETKKQLSKLTGKNIIPISPQTIGDQLKS